MTAQFSRRKLFYRAPATLALPFGALLFLAVAIALPLPLVLAFDQMPPHRIYIEPFVGSGRVLKAKLPADRNIGIDLDGETIAQLRLELASVELTIGDGVAFLERFKWAGGELVYCDPPYLMETRASKRQLYKFEVTHHQRLLKAIKALPCDVMISGYWSSLYATELATWPLCFLSGDDARWPAGHRVCVVQLR